MSASVLTSSMMYEFKPDSKEPGSADSLVLFRNSQGLELQATLLKLSRFRVTVETYGPPELLRLSEALAEFRILIQGQVAYAGRAVVDNLIQVGPVTVCEATLDDEGVDSWVAGMVTKPQALQTGFQRFISEVGKDFRIRPEFKLAMADMQAFFQHLRLWMEQLELGVRTQPGGSRSQIEHDALTALEHSVLPAAAPALEAFEAVANTVEPESQPAHRAYMRRQIHPLVLCSPFLFRTYKKPLGFAGDYEMVNMMLRDPFEGASMYAKMVNRIFLATPPVVAHRKRLDYLAERLDNEAVRLSVRGRPLRVFSLGCGPAREIQSFLARQELSDVAQFTLLDFDEEAISFAAATLGEMKSRHGRATQIQTVRRSVYQILKDSGKPVNGPKYDLVYCAGLFDYLSDQVCKRLNNLLYELVAPGGLLVTTNVSTSNPSRNWMEYVLDWHLVYRSASQFATLAPERAVMGNNSVQGIGDGVNIALEARKPEDAR